MPLLVDPFSSISLLLLHLFAGTGRHGGRRSGGHSGA